MKLILGTLVVLGTITATMAGTICTTGSDGTVICTDGTIVFR